MYDLVTVSLRKSYNSVRKLLPSNAKMSPFYIEKEKLIEIGKLIESSKAAVPISFNSKWVDPIKNSGDNCAVDYFNFSLYQLPTCFVSFFENKQNQKAVANLVKACQLCMKWSITSDELKVIKKNFESWVSFLKQQVEKKNIGPGALLKPTQHYLLHIEYIMRQNGPLRAFSARSMEQAIGKYKKLTKSKSSVGENAGNIIIRLANKPYITNLPWSLSEAVNLLAARSYSGTTYKDHPVESSQLWEPFHESSLMDLPFGIEPQEMTQALQRFHARVIPNGLAYFLQPESISVAGCAWGYGRVHLSQLYADQKTNKDVAVAS